MAEPEDYEARATLMLAGSLSHNGLMGAGRACGLWAHKLEHEMSGLDDRIAHGAGLAVVWPAYLQFFANRGAGGERLFRYAVNFWGVEPDYTHPERTIQGGIDACRAYFDSLGMPSRLGDLGLTEADIPVMAASATDNGRISYPAIIPMGLEESWRYTGSASERTFFRRERHIAVPLRRRYGYETSLAALLAAVLAPHAPARGLRPGGRGHAA